MNKIIKERRSVRKFIDKEIPDDNVWESIGVTSPSSKFCDAKTALLNVEEIPLPHPI